MRPLTDTTPKPLLAVAGKPLIVWHLEQLAAMGIHDVAINTSWLARQFQPALGDGSQWGLRLHYSYEGNVPLETGGGMLHALQLLDIDGDEAFIAVNGDIWTDYAFTKLPPSPAGNAHLVLVDNPAHNSNGDFALDAAGVVHSDREPRLTFSGIGVYRPGVLEGWRTVIGNTPGAACEPPRFGLAPLLRAAIQAGQVSGELHHGLWTDVGTPGRLRELDARLRRESATR